MCACGERRGNSQRSQQGREKKLRDERRGSIIQELHSEKEIDREREQRNQHYIFFRSNLQGAHVTRVERE